MATTLTLDRGLDFDRALPGERPAGGHPVPVAVPAPALPTSDPRGSRHSWTLDELIVGAWEDLLATRSAACPLCGGAMAPRHGAGPVPVGGRCGSCETALE
jgi:hypothetical protein